MGTKIPKRGHPSSWEANQKTMWCFFGSVNVCHQNPPNNFRDDLCDTRRSLPDERPLPTMISSSRSKTALHFHFKT